MAANCCAGSPSGNPLCWDTAFTFERCCGSVVAVNEVEPPESCSTEKPCSPAGVTTPARGAPPYLQDNYSRTDGQFWCLDGVGTALPQTVINDDYCDCSDGSDEPGTSACAGQVSRPSVFGFYCQWRHVESRRHQTVRYSAINDAVCDCCNGADEWEEKEGEQCPDTCELQEDLAPTVPFEVDSRVLRGRQAREQYVLRGHELTRIPPYSDWPQDTDSDFAFIALAEKGCFSQDDGRNFYKFCLFDRITHSLGQAGREFILGRGSGRWRQAFWEDGRLRNDYSHLTVQDGEWCHRISQNRNVEIDFECAPQDSLVSITESTLCSFSVLFETPAVCL